MIREARDVYLFIHKLPSQNNKIIQACQDNFNSEIRQISVSQRSLKKYSLYYLAFAAMLSAGLDRIENRIDPGELLGKDTHGLSPEKLENVPSIPSSLEETFNALEEGHEFLMKEDVFTDDAIFTWIDYKRQHEVNPIRLRPHPCEFALYYDI